MELSLKKIIRILLLWVSPGIYLLGEDYANCIVWSSWKRLNADFHVPLKSQKIWTSGVTYYRNREGRQEGSKEVEVVISIIVLMKRKEYMSRRIEGENPLYLPQAKNTMGAHPLVTAFM